MSVRKNIAEHFFDHYVETPAHPALFVEEQLYSYGKLAARARAVAGWLETLALPSGARVALVAAGSVDAYAALLGCAWAGVTYVPLSPWFPPDYVHKLLERTGADVVIADVNGMATLSAVEGWRSGAHFLDLSKGFGQLEDCLHFAPSEPVALPPSAIVHIMFTSGSTGEPKMIGATLANIDAYLTASQERYAFTASDKVSHYNELGWDPYLLDLFGAWEVGACTFAVPKSERLAPAGFIHRHALTTWFSVPSTVVFMDRLKMLTPGLLPTLRLSLFVGEPLHLDTVKSWRRAAPDSRVENVYGPTECTVVCTGFSLAAAEAEPATTPGRDYAPIGTPYAGSAVGIIDEDRHFMRSGEVGQIAISGAQVAPGYVGDPQGTDSSFVLLTHPELGQRRWYLTGDLGLRDDDGVYHFMGRADNQVKVLGNRVELEAVEAALRAASGCEEVAVVPGAVKQGITQWLGAAVVGCELTPELIKREMAARVPSYMVPKRLVALPRLPRNSNGKVDRAALRQVLL